MPVARETIEERRARLTPGALWIRAQREERGWSGRELARRMDIPQDRISAYERAQDEPPTEFARGLAKVFELSELEVWEALRKPLPRDVDISGWSKEEVIAYVERRFPGELERLRREREAPTPTQPGSNPEASGDTPETVTQRGETGRSASL